MSFSVIDLINNIGMENVHVQQISNSFCNLKRRRDGLGELTFTTEQSHLPELDIENARINFDYEGLIVWCKNDHFREAVDRLNNDKKPKFAYYLQFESEHSMNKSMITTDLNRESMKKFLMMTEPFIKNFEMRDFVDNGQYFQDFIENILDKFKYSNDAPSEQEVILYDNDYCFHKWIITKSELI